jgi:hypothetical protein
MVEDGKIKQHLVTELCSPIMRVMLRAFGRDLVFMDSTGTVCFSGHSSNLSTLDPASPFLTNSVCRQEVQISMATS